MRKYNDIYPLFAILAALIICITGFLIVKGDFILQYLVVIILIYIIFGYKDQLFRYIPLLVIIPGLMFAFSYLFGRNLGKSYHILLRALIFGLSVILGLSIKPGDLFRVVINKGMPSYLALGILVAMQFIKKMAKELSIINQARKVRGKNKNMSLGQRIYRGYLIPIVLRVFTISDTLGASIEMRGFTMDDKGNYLDLIHPGTKDYLFMISIIASSGIGVYKWLA